MQLEKGESPTYQMWICTCSGLAGALRTWLQAVMVDSGLMVDTRVRLISWEPCRVSSHSLHVRKEWMSRATNMKVQQEAEA